MDLKYSYDGEKLMGTGGALRRAGAAARREDVFWVMYGDSYMDIDYRGRAGGSSPRPRRRLG